LNHKVIKQIHDSVTAEIQAQNNDVCYEWSAKFAEKLLQAIIKDLKRENK
jgi:4-aminobutyrate aminotransferase-like enzyme